MRACRILVIEDDQVAVEDLQRKLTRRGGELGLTVDIVALRLDHYEQFTDVFDQWYLANGQPVSPNYAFDFWSLDLILKAVSNANQTDGGERLHLWLDRRGIVPHLGKLVVRSNKKSDYFASQRGTFYVAKQTDHEDSQWRRLLEEFRAEASRSTESGR